MKLIQSARGLFAAGEAIQVFRTVGAEEAAAIAASGRYSNLPWVAGKYFFPTLEQAVALAAKYEAANFGTQVITSGVIPRAALAAAEVISPAGEGLALYLAGDDILRQIQNVVSLGGLK